jgi:hypothetical protein
MERQALLREKDKHERKQRKLLEAHYADAIPLSFFKQEQDQLAAMIIAIDRQLESHDTQYGLIFGQEAKPEPKMKNPANLRGLSELARQFTEWRNRRIFWAAVSVRD